MLFKSYEVEKNINIINQSLILFYGENIGLKNYFKNTLKKNDNYEPINFNQDELIKNKNLIMIKFLIGVLKIKVIFGKVFGIFAKLKVPKEKRNLKIQKNFIKIYFYQITN